MDSRIFIGIKAPDDMKEDLVKIQQELKLAELKAKFVESENLHINLKFLGNTPQEEIEKISFAIQNSAEKFQKFNVSVNGLGVFPELKNPRVIWAGVSSEELINFHSILEKNLSEIGIPKDSRKFTPHITLARISSANKAELEKTMHAHKDNIGDFEVSEISMIESELSEKGPKYSDLRKFRLGD